MYLKIINVVFRGRHTGKNTVQKHDIRNPIFGILIFYIYYSQVKK